MPQIIHCARCHHRISGYPVFERGGERMCEPCYTNTAECEHCNEMMDLDEATAVEGFYYCYSCIEEYFDRCERCDRLIHNDNFMATESASVCPECFAEIRNSEDREQLRSHSYKPRPDFYIREYEKDPLTFGVELEIEAGDSPFNIEKAVALISKSSKMPDTGHSFLYCKHDGSLHCGLEVVSMPFSWEWYKLNRWVYTQVFRLAQKGYSSYDNTTCGMHVHISKRHFTSLHLWKFMSLIYDEHNSDFITKISGRNINLLNQWASTKEIEKRTIRAATKGQSGTARYTAVNLQNTRTVEIRIFKGTLRRQSFEKNIEFCLAAFEYTRDVKPEIPKGLKITPTSSYIHYEDFIKYIIKHKRQYLNLYSWIKKNYKGMIQCV